jgi:hypothetical protein
MDRSNGRSAHRWRRWALLPVVALACAGCSGAVRGAPAATPVPVLSSADVARQSLVNLAEAGVVHYRGSLVNPDGKPITLDVSITTTGEVGGTVGTAGQQGSLVDVGHTLYVDAPSAFWSALAGDPGTQGPAVASRWVRVPSVTLGIDIGAILGPGALGDDLTRELTAANTPLGSAPSTTLDGTRAVEVPVGKGTVYLATAEPHGVLRVNVPSGLGDATDVSLDVVDVSPSEPGVYQGLEEQAAGLSSAVDSSVSIQQGSQSWGPCSATGCSVVVMFTNTGATATKVVVDGNWTGDGQPAGTCQVVVGPVAAGRPTRATCTNHGPQWNSFYSHAHVTPGQHPYEVDWTAEALAPQPNLTTLHQASFAASTPAAQDAKQVTGSAYVYVIHYQDPQGVARVWKYGVTATRSWQQYAAPQLTACRATSRTSCAVDLVTAAASRPSADALVASLVTAAIGDAGRCPPGQWVDCTGSAAR